MDVTSYMLGKKAGGGTITETDPIFSNSAASGITSTDIGNWNDKQDELVSGTNIKTINNESILGSGNITIQGGGDVKTFYIENNGFSNPLILNDLEPGIYFFKYANVQSTNQMMITLYLRGTSSNTGNLNISVAGNSYIQIFKKYSQASNGEVFAILNSDFLILSGKLTPYIGTFKKNTVNSSGVTNDYFAATDTFNNFKVVELSTSASTISAKKTFSVLPESSITPTSNNQLTNKSYVDTAISNAITSTLGGSY